MLLFISPTKQMQPSSNHQPNEIPMLIAYSKQILQVLQKQSIANIQTLMKVNEKIAKENVERYQHIHLDERGSCAIDTYHGLQFQYMRLDTQEQLDYVQKHVRILSGLYGVLKPFDSIEPYRLEMQAPLSVSDSKDIYEFWKDRLAIQLLEEVSTHSEPYLINLASKEYEKAILPYVPVDSVIHVSFKVRKQGKLKSESTAVKMARGRMIHFLSEHQIEQVEDIKFFDEDGYTFQKEMSDQHHFVFVKEMTV